MPKYYTPKEANNLLEIVRPMVFEVMTISEKIQASQPELWDLAQKSAGNGGNAKLSKLLPDFDRLHKLLHDIQDMDIEIKDPISGLIDFVALKDDREIYLCWKYGEEQIQFWHEIEAGFAGRQKIDWE
jgi:hypothetical protein